jgi:hypothetical protein
MHIVQLSVIFSSCKTNSTTAQCLVYYVIDWIFERPALRFTGHLCVLYDSHDKQSLLT